MQTSSINILTNEQAFESFFRENYDAFCRFANGFTHDAEDAEEIVQSTFVKLWESRQTMVIGAQPKAYLFTMIRNACLNQIKHISVREEYKRYNEQEIQILQEETNIGDLNLPDKIQIAIRNMPPQRKKIFEMSRFEGLKYKEIAAHLSISIKTVESHMGSAMKDLRLEFKDYLHLAFIYYLIEELGENVNSIVLLLG